MNILITGATGFIGTKVVDKLKDNHSLYITSRNIVKAQEEFPFAKVVSINEIDHLKLDGVVHLQGLPISSIWSKKNKEIIYSSRIDPLKKIAKLKLKFLVGASAQSIYENDKLKVRKEEEKVKLQDNFLSKVAFDWEKYTNKSKTRVVNLRISMVLGERGFLSKLIPQFKYGFGGYFGDKDSGISWIHVDDLVSIIEWAIKDTKVNGPINCAANYTSNYNFMKTLARVLNKPFWLHVPAFIIKLLGEQSQLLLASVKMKSKYQKFKYTNLEKALKSIVLK